MENVIHSLQTSELHYKVAVADILVIGTNILALSCLGNLIYNIRGRLPVFLDLTGERGLPVVLDLTDVHCTWL